MNKLRMTAEEINEKNPSFYSPIELVCDNRVFRDDMKKIKVVLPIIGDKLCYIDNRGILTLTRDAKVHLENYPSLKTPPFKPKTVRMYLDVEIKTEESLKTLKQIKENNGRCGGMFCTECAFNTARGSCPILMRAALLNPINLEEL